MERYLAFWRRFGASIFDSILLLPVYYFVLINVTINDPGSVFICTSLPIVFTILYRVFLTGLTGQTVGKIVMGIKVLDINEKDVIGIKRAFYRDSIYIIIETMGIILSAYKNLANGSIPTVISNTVNYLSDTALSYWTVLELITMLFNSKRRAVHDYLASSVVISLKGQRFDLHYEQLERQRASKQLQSNT